MSVAAGFSKILSGFLGVSCDLRGTFAKLCCQNQGLRGTLASLLVTHLKSESIKEVTSIFLIDSITLVLHSLGRFGALPALLLSFHCPNSAGSTLPLLHRLLTRFAGSSASKHKKTPPPTKKCYSNHSCTILTSPLSSCRVCFALHLHKLWRSTPFPLQKPINRQKGVAQTDEVIRFILHKATMTSGM